MKLSPSLLAEFGFLWRWRPDEVANSILIYCRIINTEPDLGAVCLCLVHTKLQRRHRDETQALQKRLEELESGLSSTLVWSVSEDKRREEYDRLKENEEYLKVIFEYAPDGYYLSDLKGFFIDGNRAAEEIVGFKREELLGKNFLMLNAPRFRIRIFFTCWSVCFLEGRGHRLRDGRRNASEDLRSVFHNEAR